MPEMNEQEIQAQNKPADNPHIDSEGDNSSAISGRDVDPQTKIELYNFLNLDLREINSEEIGEKLSDMKEWALSHRPDAKTEDIISLLRMVESKIGRNPEISITDHLWNYIRLDMERTRIESKMKSFEQRW